MKKVIKIEGLEDVTIDTIKELLNVDKDMWTDEAKGIEEFYAQFGDRLPNELKDQLATLKANLK